MSHYQYTPYEISTIFGFHDSYDREMWVRVPWNDSYFVSNFGRVLHEQNVCFDLARPFGSQKGYLQIYMYEDGNRKLEYIHRLVAELFLKNFDSHKVVSHIDGDIKNNYYLNLRISTKSEVSRSYSEENVLLQPCKIVEDNRIFPNGYACSEEIHISTTRLKQILAPSGRSIFGWHGFHFELLY